MTYVPKTTSGYLLGEVVSALQKEIRRGNEWDACFWAMELDGFYSKYLWKRLRIIAIEDIGIADPSIFPIVNQAAQFCLELKEEGKKKGYQAEEASMILCGVVSQMCRAKKSRLADDLYCLLKEKRKAGLLLDIPDYALDCHTARGKQMGRGDIYFYEEGAKVSPEGDADNPYHDECVAVYTELEKAKKCSVRSEIPAEVDAGSSEPSLF